MTQKYINDYIVLKNSLFFFFHHTSAMDLKDLVTFTSEGDSQLKNSHESLTKCSDRQHNPVNIRLVQIEIPCSLELLQ